MKFSACLTAFLYASFRDSDDNYSVGQSAVRAQVIYNCTKLDTSDDFKSASTNFVADTKTIFRFFQRCSQIRFYKDTDRNQTDAETLTGFIYGEYKPNKFYINTIGGCGRSDIYVTSELSRVIRWRGGELVSINI